MVGAGHVPLPAPWVTFAVPNPHTAQHRFEEQATVSSPAAWHPDPTGRHEHRYWDGDRWTEHVADQGVATTDPLDGPTSGSAGASADQPAMPPIESDPGSPASSGPSDPAAPQAQPFASAGGSVGGSPPSYSVSGGFPAASPTGQAPAATGSNVKALIAMILGIASIVLSWVGVLGRTAGVVMMVVAIAAVVLGIMGVRVAGRVNKGRGMAITAIVTGIIGLVTAGLFLVGGEFFRAFSGEFTEFVACVEETGDEAFCRQQFEDRILDRVED